MMPSRCLIYAWSCSAAAYAPEFHVYNARPPSRSLILAMKLTRLAMLAVLVACPVYASPVDDVATPTGVPA